MTETTSAATIDELRCTVRGGVFAPGDPGYADAAMTHTGPGTPDVVVQPLDEADVGAAVRWAASAGMPVVARGGGHSAWGLLAGGVALDLASLADVEVGATGIVSTGGGATWGAVARIAAPLGWGISSGDTATVGVGGNTLGGGIGWMVRRWGLALDQLIAARIVTAAGEAVTASADEHPDLFWAIRGGGGNFGVVTRFDFQAHRLPAVVFGSVPFGDADTAVVLRAWRDLMRTAPRELTATFMDVPEIDPSAPGGRRLDVCWAGDDEAAARAALEPLFGLPGIGEPEIAVSAYPDILLDAPPLDPAAAGGPPPTIVDANGFLATLDDDAIDAILTAHDARGTAMLMIRYLGGGAFGDVAPGATALAFRNAEAFVVTAAFAAPDAPPEIVEALVDAWAPVEAVSLGMYGNFTNAVTPDIVGRMYPPSTRERLARVKAEWDPDNRFSRNHNVAPATV